ncbi:enoyl-CoA hydratase/isomerase family protein [Ramlibacter solisilvae]|uniref:3-hydroxyisobutyryl-CoA hydrolase n=1 Tax=Ramlibacter tataouinensis TaxID=94132 RepID=A0A127JYL9_9BURK|nr:enoyl-CoA hydratase/isomerase family protein [Ramlibacter tataouinensis]AMO24994.1 3-hydroxyisobutyryl-CoA hydrolase [Ramlibacter tataouinensis]
MSDVIAEVRGRAGLLTLNRPKALNALTLGMIRELAQALRTWRDDDRVEFVAIRGQGREGRFGAFSAGGDLRFFHQAVLAGNPELEDFFTEEYALNHLVHTFPKPYAVFMDGIVMGGGMGISGHGRTGATMRIATERTKMAMPETNIGLFPDVGGGWFLARCPGHLGEYLALTGHVIGGSDAVAAGLADAVVPSTGLPALWDAIAEGASAPDWPRAPQEESPLRSHQAAIDRFFALPTVSDIVAALESEGSEFARETAALLRKRSPLMLHVTLEHLRRARSMTLADDLRMERDIVRRCFHLRPGAASETFEGIRALVVDKDHSPRWNPVRIEEVTPAMVEPFFDSPWPAHAHPLRDLI